jgi:tetratricopeptide (TPR) repeat protein
MEGDQPIMTTSDDLYHQILTSGPSSETIYFILSKLKTEGQHSRVIQECVKALYTYPNDIPLRHLLAEAYLDAGLLAEAEAELEKVMPKLDHLATLYKLQAHVLYGQKRAEEAMKSLKIFLAHSPDDPEALQLLQAMETSPEPPLKTPSPVPEVREPLQIFPDEAEPPAAEIPAPKAEGTGEEGLPEIVTPTLAEVYAGQGQIVEAIRIYERIAAQQGDDSAVRPRIEELKAMMAHENPAEPPKEDEDEQKKAKIISILELWLEEVRKISKQSGLP